MLQKQKAAGSFSWLRHPRRPSASLGSRALYLGRTVTVLVSDAIPKFLPMNRRLRENLAALDGKHYWNCWTNNYRPERDGYCIHVFCEEDRTGRTLCGCISSDGGGESYPLEGMPSCLRCLRIMKSRSAIPA